jgi:hypothetical protein
MKIAFTSELRVADFLLAAGESLDLPLQNDLKEETETVYLASFFA